MKPSNLELTDEREKSTKLADMMNWSIIGNNICDVAHITETEEMEGGVPLCPYDDSSEGLAQFAAILLKYPDVLLIFQRAMHPNSDKWEYLLEPTQENILNEVVNMEPEVGV